VHRRLGGRAYSYFGLNFLTPTIWLPPFARKHRARPGQPQLEIPIGKASPFYNGTAWDTPALYSKIYFEFGQQHGSFGKVLPGTDRGLNRKRKLLSMKTLP
jgi:hypothetical protein